MSEKTDLPSPPHSSSDSSQSDQSLERLLGAIAKALDGLVEGNLELRRAFAEVRKDISQAVRRGETRTAELQVALDTFVLRVEAAVEHQKIAAGTTVDARRALERSQESFEKAVKDISEQFPLMSPEDLEGEAPLAVRQVAVKLANFFWPLAVRNGTAAVKTLFVAAVPTVAALAKLVYDAIMRAGH